MAYTVEPGDSIPHSQGISNNPYLEQNQSNSLSELVNMHENDLFIIPDELLIKSMYAFIVYEYS